MRLLVTGSRHWTDRNAIDAELAFLHDEHGLECVIHGDCRRWDRDRGRHIGADHFAGEWARANGVEEIACPADWKAFGRFAGPLRNRNMIGNHRPDAVLVFHEDLESSRGTKDMVNQAKRAGLPIHYYQTKVAP